MPRLLVVHLTLLDGDGRAAFAAALSTGSSSAVVLVADDLDLPRVGLELRGPGLWADHNVEEPFERWSLGLEAFGVGVDVPPATDLDVLLASRGSPELRGDRVPVGWDLEWTSVEAPEVEPAAAAALGGYRVACRVEGEVVVGAGRLELDEAGERTHHW